MIDEVEKKNPWQLANYRQYSTAGCLDYLEALVACLKAGEPIPAELAAPLIEGLERPINYLHAQLKDPRSNKLIPLARKFLCNALGIAKRFDPILEVDIADLNDDEDDELVDHAVKKIARKYKVSKRKIYTARAKIKEAYESSREVLKRIQALNAEYEKLTGSKHDLTVQNVKDTFPDGLPVKPTQADAEKLRVTVTARKSK